jgi:hypothetical protein
LLFLELQGINAVFLVYPGQVSQREVSVCRLEERSGRQMKQQRSSEHQTLAILKAEGGR